jgi:hypothetical protein
MTSVEWAGVTLEKWLGGGKRVGGAGGQGDKGTREQGNKGTRGQGELNDSFPRSRCDQHLPLNREKARAIHKHSDVLATGTPGATGGKPVFSAGS